MLTSVVETQFPSLSKIVPFKLEIIQKNKALKQCLQNRWFNKVLYDINLRKITTQNFR